jgi:hypothetical protein
VRHRKAILRGMRITGRMISVWHACADKSSSSDVDAERKLPIERVDQLLWIPRGK